MKTVRVQFRDAVGNTSPVYSDSIALGTPISIAQAKAGPLSFLVLSGVDVSAIFADHIYVEQPDRSGGIRIVGTSGLNVGDRVDIAGALSQAIGESFVNAVLSAYQR